MSAVPSRPATGFTIIELVVVLALFGILAAAAVTAISRSHGDNQERLAVTSVDAVTAAQVDFAGRYGVFTSWPADLDLPDGPAVTVGASDRPRLVSVAVAADGTVAVAAGTSEGRCVLRTVTGPLDGMEMTTRRGTAGETCVASVALPDGATLLTPRSRLP